MVLKEDEVKKILNYVKKEPRTVQEISKLIKKSWVTADSYVQQIKERNGLLDIKTFRSGTQGALKIVFYNQKESVQSDEIRDELYHQIRMGKMKNDFDFMELYQYVNHENKQAYQKVFDEDNGTNEKEIFNFLKEAKTQVYSFSGNLSFLKSKKIMGLIEELLEKGVSFKFLARVNVASLSNMNALMVLMEKYPGKIEVRHRYHPLRGFVVDDEKALFKREETSVNYRKNELDGNMIILYQVNDKDWVSWLQKVFWNFYRSALDYEMRIKELNQVL